MTGTAIQWPLLMLCHSKTFKANATSKSVCLNMWEPLWQLRKRGIQLPFLAQDPLNACHSFCIQISAVQEAGAVWEPGSAGCPPRPPSPYWGEMGQLLWVQLEWPRAIKKPPDPDAPLFFHWPQSDWRDNPPSMELIQGILPEILKDGMYTLIFSLFFPSPKY